MSGVNALEARLRAWRAFREVAHATRSLAAAHAARWTGARERVAVHAAWTRALARPVLRREEPADGPCVLLAIGTDLGLCGRLTPAVADAVREAARGLDLAGTIVVGVRLADLLEPSLRARVERTPSTLDAATALAASVAADVLDRPGSRLAIVSAVDVSAAGAPRVVVRRGDATEGEAADRTRTPDEVVARASLLGRPARHREWARRALLQGRAAEALIAASLVEATVRLAAMTRAHEVAERRIEEQERALAKARQEGVTQELLEAIGGRRRASAPMGG